MPSESGQPVFLNRKAYLSNLHPQVEMVFGMMEGTLWEKKNGLATIWQHFGILL
jgi:hypothetical protein